MSDIFISYARSDAKRAREIADRLTALGYAVWRDDALPAHRNYAEVIQERIDQARAVLVLWSAEAVRSQWVRSEANRAREQAKLVQASLASVIPPMPFDQIQCAELSDGNDAGWLKVVESLDALVGTAPMAAPHAPQRPGARRKAVAGVAAALVIVASGLGAWLLLHRTGEAGAGLRTVAIMPIRNLTGDAAADPAADRLTEDVIDILGRGGDIVVAPRDAVFGLKGQTVDARSVGRKLGVRNVVVASLRKASPGYRVSFQMIDSASGHVVAASDVGAESPDGPAADNRLALNLFAAIDPAVLNRWRVVEMSRPENDRDPDNLTARMMALADRGSRDDLAAFRRLLAAAGAAIPNGHSLRPSFDNRACAYLEDLLAGGLYRSRGERAAWATQALALGAESQALRPNATAPYICRAEAFGALGRWDEGMAEAQYVIDRFPLTANGYSARGDLRFARGQFAEALKDFTELAARTGGDPSDIGATLLFMGDYGGAISALREQAVHDPRDPAAPFYLTAALQLDGRHAEALETAASFRRLNADDSLWKNLALSREPAFMARAAIVRQGLHDAGLVAPSSVSQAF